MTVDQRLNHMERQIKQQRVGLFVLAAALCGVVSIAATDSEYGFFDGVSANVVTADTVIAKRIRVENDEGKSAITLTSNTSGNGHVQTHNATTGKSLVVLSDVGGGYGVVSTYSPSDKEMVRLMGTENGGMVTVYNNTVKGGVIISGKESGGVATVANNAGKWMATLYTDDYGNGKVVVWDRNGGGNVLESK